MPAQFHKLSIVLVISLLVLFVPVTFAKKITSNQSIKPSHYQLSGIGDSDNGIDPGVGRPKTQVLSPDDFEKVDPGNGQLTLDLPSINLPGPAGLDLQVHFVYNPDLTWIVQHMGTPDLGNYWRVDFGVINKSPLIPTQYDNLHFPILYLPDGTEKMFFLKDGTNNEVYYSEDNWRGIVDKTANTFTVTSPYGLIYIFKPIHSTFQISQMKIAEIEDTHGNWIKFTRYDGYESIPSALTQITTSDGREIDFNYSAINQDGQVAHLITSMVVNGQTWNFQYTSLKWNGEEVTFLLSEIDRPDGTKWQFQYSGCPTRWDGFQWWHAFISQLTTPYNATINYQYQWYKATGPNEPGWYDFYTLISQTMDDNAGHNWTRNYSYSYDSNATVMTQTITDPTKEEVYQTYGAISAADGTVWRVGLPDMTSIYNPSNSTPLQTISYQWDKDFFTDYKQYTNTFIPQHRDAETYRPQLIQKTTTQDGTDYTETFANFDEYEHPQQISSQGQTTNITHLTYLNDTNNWILDPWTSKTISDSGAINRSFDGIGDLTDVNQYSVETEFNYTPDGDVASETDANNHTTNFSNYKYGQAQTINYPIGGITENRTVNDAGMISSVSDPMGNTIGYQYDGLNRVTEITPPQGAATTITYNTPSPGSYTEQRGDLETITMVDGFGHPVEIENIDTKTGRTIKQVMQYDMNGRLIFKSFPFDNQHGLANLGDYYQYDALDRLTQHSWPTADGSTATYTYNANNQVIMTDPLGNKTVYQYYSYGDPSQKQLISVQQPNGITTIIDRNGLGQITKVTQDNFSRIYNYNEKYFLTSEIDPETGVTTFGRDNIGLMTSREVGNSGITHYIYDEMNHLIQTIYPNSTPMVRQLYDKDGRLSLVSNMLTNWNYQYDANSNLTNATLSLLNDGTYSFTFNYDNLDHLEAMTYPDGTIVNYGPDAYGWPTALAPFISNISFFPDGKTRAYTAANNVVTNYSENDNNLLSGISVEKGYDILIDDQYNYDLDGNLSLIEDDVNSKNNISLGYDQNNRLIKAVGPWGSGTIVYDDNGNISNKVMGNSLLGYSYDSNTNLLKKVAGSQNEIFNYDAYGDITSNGIDNFIYNDAQQLIQATGKDDENNPFTLNYSYDGENNRVLTNSSSMSLVNAYIDDKLLYANDITKNAITDYIYLGDHLVATAQHAENTPATADNASYPSDNILGSPILETDANGEISWRQTYLPYGHESEDNSGQSEDHPGYLGKSYSKLTQLSYLGARYYDPIIGRFMAADPEGFTDQDPLSFNRYAYGDDNPYRFEDPRGKFVILINALALEMARGAIVGYQQTGTMQGAINGAITGLKAGAKEAAQEAEIGTAVGIFLGSQPFVGEEEDPLIGGALLDTTAGKEVLSEGKNIIAEKAEGMSTTEDALEEAKPSISGKDLPIRNSAEPPKEGFEWRGKGPPGEGKGAWFNPSTRESLYPDLDHKAPLGPHWDYRDSNKNDWRLYPDGTWEQK